MVEQNDFFHPDHLSKASIRAAFSRGWDIGLPERTKIDLPTRYGSDLSPSRLITNSPDQVAFFLDCRFLGFTGKCAGGHNVNPLYGQYGPALVKIQSGVIVARFEWSGNIKEGRIVAAGSLGSKSDLWHSISKESFITFLGRRNVINKECQREISDQIEAVELMLLGS